MICRVGDRVELGAWQGFTGRRGTVIARRSRPENLHKLSRNIFMWPQVDVRLDGATRKTRKVVRKVPEIFVNPADLIEDMGKLA